MADLAGLLIHVFFRGVDVEGASLLPPNAPTVLVANHQNGLVDGLLLMAALPRYPRFVGKSTLFKIVPLRPFLALAGVIPVYRASDGATTAHNESMFRTCRRILAERGVVAIFPEGISHDQPDLQPLKTGAARIALGAALGDGTGGVVTVPVALVYDAKARFRSRAVVRVGSPTDVTGWVDTHPGDQADRVHLLTDHLADRLRSLGVEGGAVAPVLAWRSRHLTSTFSPRADRAGLEELDRALMEYERDLALLGLTDGQVAAQGTLRLRLTVAGRLLETVVAVPAVVVGAVIHVVPYQVMKRLAMIPTNESIKSTVKLLGCFALFTLEYVALAVVVALRISPLAGLAAFLAAPLTGWATVRAVERARRVGGLVEGSRALRRSPDVLNSLRNQRLRISQLAVAAAPPVAVNGGVAHH